MIDFPAAIRHVLNHGTARRSVWPSDLYLDCLTNQYGKVTVIRQLAINSGHPYLPTQEDMIAEDWVI